MCEAEPLCAENIGLKDIAESRRGELISRGELIMYYMPCCEFSIMADLSDKYYSTQSIRKTCFIGKNAILKF